MKKKVTVTAKAIVNDGKGQISIIITDNLPSSAICIIGRHIEVKHRENEKRYVITFVNHRIPDYLRQYECTINDVVWKMVKYLNRKGLKDCIIHEESITKTYGKVVDKIVVGVDTKHGNGKLYVHCYLPDRKEYFELDIYNRQLGGGANWHLVPDESLKLSKLLDEDEYNVVEDKLLRVLDELPETNKSFVKTIKC